MRIIAGKARGIRIEAPQGKEIRPTLDRVRESLFNILGPHIEEARFLDLFAGTGAIGLEALSRGAERVTFVDAEKRALAIVRDNLLRTKLVGQVRCARLTLPRGLEEIHGVFNFVFADPPYHFPHYTELLEALSAAACIDPEARIIIEHRKNVQLPDAAARFTRSREKNYGDTTLSFYDPA